MAFRAAPAALMLSLLLTSCTTIRMTEPARSATEQLLISTAVDHAVEGLSFNVPESTKILIDTKNFSGYDVDYAIGAIKEHLLRHKALLVTDEDEADMIVEIRAGALSIDKKKKFFGIPGFSFPVPVAGELKFPEIALFKQENWQGIAKFALLSYDAKNGALKTYSGPVYGSSSYNRWTLFLVSWTTSDLLPEGIEK